MMDDSILKFFQLIVLVFSVMIHEVAHGATALKLGDTTARDQGRLTLNPLKHIDPFGSVLLPLALVLINSPILIGWAKPVPYNPAHLKNPKVGSGIIGAAGPLANILVAVIFGIILRLVLPFGAAPNVAALILLLNIVVFLNVLLAIFNLLPIPPLDGFGVLLSVLPEKYRQVKDFLVRYGFFILILFILFGFSLILPIINFVYQLIAGPAALF